MNRLCHLLSNLMENCLASGQAPDKVGWIISKCMPEAFDLLKASCTEEPEPDIPDEFEGASVDMEAEEQLWQARMQRLEDLDFSRPKKIKSLKRNSKGKTKW